MPNSTALTPLSRIDAATTELEARVSGAVVTAPAEAEALLRDLGVAQRLADLAGLSFHEARLSVARDRLIEKLDPLVPCGPTAGPGRGKTSSREEVVSKPLRQVIQSNRTEWKGVPPERRETVRQEAVDQGAPLTRQWRMRERGKHDAAERAQHVRDTPPALPPSNTPWQVVYADPPWRYEHVRTESRAIERQYPTMSLTEILQLSVPGNCAADAVLYLWAPSPKLTEALSVMEAWGFTYRSSMVWVKPSIGMGYWARARHELLLIGTRGSFRPPPPALRPDSVIEAPAAKHSEKPVQVAELLERLYPVACRVELFSRSPRPTWLAHGTT